MNDPVAALNVGLGNVGAVNHDLAALRHDLYTLAVNGLGLAKLHHVLRHHVACDYVVGENSDQFLFVFRLEQIFQGPGRQLGKCLVGGRENRERSRSLEGFDQASGF